MNHKFHKSVLLAQQGDIDAFAKLVNDTSNLVTSTALSVTGDIDASEDVAQQTYLDAWQQLSKLKSPESFLPWLRQITRNKAKNYLRDNKVTRTVNLNNERQAETCETIETSFAQQQTEQTLMELIEALPAENRDILILYYRENQSTAQVARLMDLSETNVRKKLSRIRTALKHELLHKLGTELVRTSPGILFTTGITSVIASSLPTSAVAATAVNASVGTKVVSGWAVKLLAVLGGALAGGIAAITAILFASKIMQRKLTDAQQKRFLKRYSRGQIIWVVLSVICFAASYEFTTGWIAPVAVYGLFLMGLMLQQAVLMKYTKQYCSVAQRKGQLAGWIGVLLGASVGFGATVMGLINSGRMLF